MCDVLVEKSLVRRRSHADNRRNVVAELTTRGRRLVTQVMDHRRALIDAVLDEMPAPGRRRVAVALSEFAVAAGELSDDAWTLGWPVDRAATQQPGDR
jgi:DNA-binding MarR family transcriptional regulator